MFKPWVAQVAQAILWTPYTRRPFETLQFLQGVDRGTLRHLRHPWARSPFRCRQIERVTVGAYISSPTLGPSPGGWHAGTPSLEQTLLAKFSNEGGRKWVLI